VLFRLEGPHTLWFGLLPATAGVFGVGLGLVTIVAVSLWDRHRGRPRAAAQASRSA
jgi:hypothetical protein